MRSENKEDEKQSDYIEEKVNIEEYPVIDLVAKAELTLGDLHANPIKFLYSLVRHRVVQLSEINYLALVELYNSNKGQLSKACIAEFNRLVGCMKVSTATRLRLIGDEVADRGWNDYYMLKILDVLHQKNVPIDIMLSNHGMHFVAWYEAKVLKKKSISVVTPASTQSSSNLKSLIDQKVLDWNQISLMIRRCYKPKLKLLDYSWNREKNCLSLYSHAPVGLNIICAVANCLNVKYDDNDACSLAYTIDQINAKFRKHVDKNTVTGLYQSYVPIYRTLWNRKYTGLNRPANHNGYKLKFVHGHEISPEVEDHLLTLDSSLGAMYNLPGANNYCCFPGGSHRVVLSNDIKFTLKDIFHFYVEKIKSKRDEFKGKPQQKYQDAYQAADTLYNGLYALGKDYIPSDANNDRFVKACCQKLNKAKPLLSGHRGWGGLLEGFVNTLMVGTVITPFAHKYITGNWFFSKRTDSAKKLDRFEEKLNNLASPAA